MLGVCLPICLPACLSVGQMNDVVEYKHCQISRSCGGEFNLNGTKRTFMGLQELLACYHKETVRSDGVVFHFNRGCPPKAKGTCPGPGRGSEGRPRPSEGGGGEGGEGFRGTAPAPAPGPVRGPGGGERGSEGRPPCYFAISEIFAK